MRRSLREPLVKQIMTGFALLAVAVVAVLAGPQPSRAAGAPSPADVGVQWVNVIGGLSVEDFPLATAHADAPTLDIGRRFTMLGLTCDVPTAPGSVSVRLRTSLDARSWSRWLTAPLEPCAEGGGGRAFTEPLWTGAARFVQVRAAAGSSNAPSRLTDVRVVGLAPEADVGRAAPSDSKAGVAQDPARPDEKGVVTSAARRAGVSAPVIVTRSQWGADESLRSGSPEYAPVRMVFVHHTAGGNDYSVEEAAAVVRGIYAYHTKVVGYRDIGYNFLIDRFGTIYEGRAGGVRRGVVGAQVLGFNAGSCGVSLMGNFAGDAPSAAALASLQKLLAWKLKVHHLNPRGTTTMRCAASEKFAAGARVKFPVIAGHRQANHTECPGNVFYPLLPVVRLEAAGRPQPPIVALFKAVPVRFSPNNDRVLDTALLRVSWTKVARWRIDLRNASGRRLERFTGRGSTAEVPWTGQTPMRHAYRDGSYTAVVSAASQFGAAVPRKVKLTIDTVAPRIRSVAVQSRRFSPNGDAWGDIAKVRFEPAEACLVRVSILDAQGRVVRRLSDWRNRSASGSTATWDGELASGRAAAEGSYRFLVEFRDAAGNTSRGRADVVLDRTIGFASAAPATFSPNGDGVSDSVMLAFALTRPAVVSVSVKAGGETVRTLALGSLDAGSQAVEWDGTTSAGKELPSCRPSFVVNAASALGTSSVTGRLVLDVDQPVLTAPAALTAVAGKAARLRCTVTDPFGGQVEVSYIISDATGVTVAAASLGRIAVGDVSWTWRPSSPGVYTISYAAVDLAGNRARAPAVTLVTVSGGSTTERSPDG